MSVSQRIYFARSWLRKRPAKPNPSYVFFKTTSDVALTPALSRLLMEVVRHVGRGDAVTLVPVSQMLTTQQAADILNVSRPHLISLLDKGEIAHSLVGRHRRIKAEHLFDYKQGRDGKRAAALSELAAVDAELL